ncbi:MAG TPA: hypothetical protein VFZ34_22110 [Blastocatellia bacterium]|nr:hypothetical protein [Blastocatellia bacterium]
MKKLSLTTGLLCVLFALAWATVPAPDFSGTWALDKAKSEGLPQQMANQDITWMITVADKSLKKEVKGGMAPQTENYKLDGTEVNEDVNFGQATMKAKRTAKVMGEMLELKSVASGEFNGNAFTMTTTQHLELADGGKTLKVHQIRESQRGNQESKLVFTKK